jgi:hypothetical protein
VNNADKEQTVSGDFRLAGIVAGINALVSMGFAVVTIADQASSTAWYAGDRAAALLAALVVVVALRHRSGLLVVGWMLVAVQAVDALIGLATANVINAIGPAVLAVATAATLVRLSHRPRGAAVITRQ